MSNIVSATHFGSQRRLSKFDIEEMKDSIYRYGYTYRDVVRGKKADVHEISFSECFPRLGISDLVGTVGATAVNNARLVYRAAKDKSNLTKTVSGIYLIDDYVDLIQKAEEYKNQGTGSNRQTLIYFKPLHCFQSMQFMKTDDGAKVIVNMRSCNLTENFLIDLALSWIVTNNVFDQQFSEIDVVMNIASLHVLDLLS